MNPSEIFLFNNQAMESLQSGKVVNSERFLLQAQALLQSAEKSPKTSRLWAITYNNLACVYKTKGDSEKALKNLFLALETEKESPTSSISLSSIQLNISAIYSSMNFHKKSLQYSLQALYSLKFVVEDSEMYWTSLASAYLSAGIEYQALFQQDLAFRMFDEGFEIASKHLGSFHLLTIKLKKALQNLDFAKIKSRSVTPTRMNNQSKPIKPMQRLPEKLRLIHEPVRLDFSPLNRSVNHGRSNQLPTIQSRLKRNNQGFSSVKRQSKVTDFEITKPKFERLPKSIQRASPLPQSIPVKTEPKEGKQFTLETDTEDQPSSLSSISEDIDTKKLSDSVDPNEVTENRFEAAKPGFFLKPNTSEVGVLCDLSTRKSTKDEEVQTSLKSDPKLLPKGKKSSGFKRIAAQIIQKHWKSFQLSRSLKKLQKPEAQVSRLSSNAVSERVTNFNSVSSEAPTPVHLKLFIRK